MIMTWLKIVYEYLLSMQVRSFTKDKYDKLCKGLENKEKELEKLKNH